MQVIVVVLYFAAGIFQMWLGFVGAAHYGGTLGGIGIIALSMMFRSSLPLMIAGYFGAVDVLGWPWWGAVLAVAPGLIFIVPALVMGAVGSLSDRRY